MKLEEIKEYVKYNPSTGSICVKRLGSNEGYRTLYPNEDSQIIVRLPIGLLKMKHDRLAWYLAYEVKPKPTEVVFHKDLDETNNKLNNLLLISKQEHFKILEALKNLSGVLRLVPHPTDVFCYVLEYKDCGRLRKEVIEDVTIARQKLLKMQLRFIKFIGKYVITK